MWCASRDESWCQLWCQLEAAGCSQQTKRESRLRELFSVYVGLSSRML